MDNVIGRNLKVMREANDLTLVAKVQNFLDN